MGPRGGRPPAGGCANAIMPNNNVSPIITIRENYHFLAIHARAASQRRRTQPLCLALSRRHQRPTAEFAQSP